MANKKTIEVGIQFSADTNRAKSSLMELQNSMNNVFKTLSTTSNLPLNKDLIKAKDSAYALQAALQSAVNVNTGKFDLSKFQQSLKQSGVDLRNIRQDFVKMGETGTKAYTDLTKAIVAAEIPSRTMNKHLNDMLKSLKDVARWKLSSGIVQGFQGALQTAYGYAQDLNKSLNDIRIVTGYSTEYMEDFAVSATKAAKALSTTTNEYTKASLIYFQQGLSDEEVARRTETTIKMANVTGEAASEVSSYMTAVWNNFDNGTKSLEYYADAITALGAATASSSEEIATGLQKFSAVASTVGLSYEYATAALATVTSETRESAETVGTAFKTIFARLESLSLGETLDDDTTMTKYSQALAQVGVDIKESNGQLKDMDQIIDEVGAKWRQINKDQQIALAQTVAGMRQYNNFIALMDNYEGFKMNVDIAADAEGTLTEQQEIYAESWEAARDRVKAAAEEIYNKLLDDDFFIKLLNMGEKILNFFDSLIDRVGGLQGVMAILSTILLKTFSNKLADGIRGVGSYMEGLFGITQKKVIDYKKVAMQEVENKIRPGSFQTAEESVEQEMMQKKFALQIAYAENEAEMSEQEKTRYQLQMKLLDIYEKQSIAIAKQTDKLQESVNATKQKLAAEISQKKAYPEKSQPQDEELQSRVQTTLNEALDNLDVGKIELEIETILNSRDIETDAFARTQVDALKAGKDLINNRSRLSDDEFLNKSIGVIDSHQTNSELIKSQAVNTAAQEAVLNFANETEMATNSYVTVAEGLNNYLNHQDAATTKLADIIEFLTSQLQNLEDGLQTAVEGIIQKAESINIDMDSPEHQDEELQELLAARQSLQDDKDLTVGVDATKKPDDRFRSLAESRAKESLGEGATEEAIKKKADEEEKRLRSSGKKVTVIEGKEERAAKKSEYDKEIDKINKKIAEKYEKLAKEIEKKATEVLGDISKSAPGDMAEGAKKDDEARKAQLELDLGEENLELYKEEIDQVEAAAEAEKDLLGLKQESNRVAEEGSKYPIPVKPDVLSSFVELTSVIGAGVTIVSTLSGVIDTISSPDATGWEVFSAVLTAIGVIVPMVIISIKTLTSEQMKSSMASLKSAAALGKENAAKLMSSAASMGLIPALKALKKTKDSETGSVNANTASWLANPIMWIALIVIGAIAAFVALVAIIVKLNDVLTETKAEKLEAAKEEAKAMASALEDAKSRAEELKSAFDSYESVRDALSECTKGTEEWNEALAENNAKVLELIEKYPKLKSLTREVDGKTEDAFRVNEETGAMEIADWAMAEVEAEAGRAVTAATIASYNAQKDLREAEIDVEEDAAAKAMAKKVSVRTYETVGNTVEDTTAEDLLDVMQYAADFKGKDAEQIREILKENFGSTMSDTQLDDWSKTIYDNIDILDELNGAIDENTKAARAETKAIAQLIASQDAALAESEYGQKAASMISGGSVTLESYKQEAEKAVAADYTKWYNEVYDSDKTLDYGDVGKEGISANSTTKDDELSKKLLAEYNKIKGTNYKYEDAKGFDGNRSFKVEGTDETIDLDTIKATLVAAKQQELFADAMKDGADALEKLAESSNKAENALAELSAERNLGGSTYAEYKDLYDYTESGSKWSTADGELTYADVMGMLDEKYGNNQDGKIGDETAKKLGYNTPEEAAQAYLEILQYTQKQWESVDLADFKFEGELDLESALNIDNAIDDLELGPVQNIRSEYIDMLNEVTSAIPEDKRRETLNKISKIDWRNQDSLKELDAILESVHVNISSGSEEWKNFDKQMKLATRSIPDYSGLIDQLNQLEGLISDIDTGSIVSKENYETLIGYNDEWKKFFSMQADGSYLFTGTQSDMVESLRAGAKSELDQLEEDYALIEKYQNGITNSNDYERDKYYTNYHYKYEGRSEPEDLDFMIAERLGYTRDQYDKIIAAGEEDEEYKALMDAISTFTSQNLEEVRWNTQNYKASLAYSKEELDILLSNQEITQEIYDNRLKAIQLKQDEIDKLQDEEALISSINLRLEEQQRINEKRSADQTIVGLKQELALVSELAVAYQAAKAAAEAENEKDKNDLTELLAAYNLEAQYDAFGNITNKEALETSLAGNDAAAKRLATLFENYDKSAADILKYSEAMIDQSEAIDELVESLEDELYTFLDLAQQVNNQELELGDVVDEDEYERLVSYNDELQKYFILTSDGYKLIKNLDKNSEIDIAQGLLNTKANRDKVFKTAKYDWSAEMALNSKNYSEFEKIASDAERLAAMNNLLGTNYSAEELTSLSQTAQSDGSSDAAATLTSLLGQLISTENINYDDLSVSSITSLGELMEFGFGEQGNLSQDSFKKWKDYLTEEYRNFRLVTNGIQDYEAALNSATETKNKAIVGSQEWKDAITAEQAAYGSIIEEAARVASGYKNNIGTFLGDLTDANGTKLSELIQEDDDTGRITNISEILAGVKYAGGDVEAAEDLLNSYNDAIDTSIEATNNQRESWVENSTAIKDWNDSIRDLEFGYLDQALSKLTDKAFTSAQAITFIRSKMTLLNESIRDTEDSMSQLASDFNLGIDDGTTIADKALALINIGDANARDKALELMDDYYSQMQEYQDLIDTTSEQITKHFEDIGAQYDKMEDKMASFSDIVASYRDIVDLVGKQNLGEGANDFLRELGTQELANAKQSLSLAKSEYERYNADRIALQEQYENTDDETIKAELKESLDEAIALEDEAYANMNEKWSEALTVANEIFQENVSLILEEMEKSIAGAFGTIDAMLEKYDQKSEISSRYLADYKQIYELSKLSRNLEKDIDNAQSIKSKQALKELQAEITELQASGTEMSAYDLENLQKRYDLRKAEIALEEAQEAKKTVRLQRDASGNWGYVYTQNADAVAQAQQTYEDKLYALQESSAKYLESTSQNILKTQDEFYQAVESIMNDASLTQEERMAKVDELSKYYTEKLEYQSGEISKIFNNNKAMYYEDWMAYSEATGYKIESSQQLATSFASSLIGELTGAGSVETLVGNFADMTTELGSRLGEAAAAWTETVNGEGGIMNTMGTSLDSFTSTATTNMNTVNDELTDLIDTLTTELPEETAFDTLLNSAIDTTTSLQSQYETMLKNYTDFINGMTKAGVNITASSYSVNEDGEVEPITGMDTGGYTGAWGDSGRLAVLHQKELVLNAADTENILNAVDLVRTISQQIDVSAMSAALGIQLRAAQIHEGTNRLEQEVTIHAEFPNATNRSEIEAAFDTLINRSAQYSNRN